jgi:hypothetical protein
MLPGQPGVAGLQLMMLFGSNGPPTHAAVPRQLPAHLTSAGPVGGHVASAGLSMQLFPMRGEGVELSSQIGTEIHCGSLHRGSAGLVGGQEGSAGLSVHTSAGIGRLSDTGSNGDEAPWKP